MLTNEKMRNHLSSLNLTTVGIDFVMRVRASPPARRPKANFALNTPVFHQSELMNHSSGRESQVEDAVGIEFDYDKENVLEYWEQIGPVVIEGCRKDGRRYRAPHVSDFLVIRRDSVTVVAPKSEKELKRLCMVRPQDWKYVAGKYHHVPAERYYNPLGIQHIVVSSAEVNQIRVENIKLLLSVRATPESPTDRKLGRRALAVLKVRRTTTIDSLATAIGTIDQTPILRLVHDRKIVCDLDNTRLSKPKSAWVAQSQNELLVIEQARQRYKDVWVNGEPPTASQVLSPKSAIALATRLALLAGKAPVTRCERTIRRYRALLRKANGDVMALVPKHHLVQRPKSHLSARHDSRIRRVIRRFIGSAKRMSARRAYVKYLAGFRKSILVRRGETPVCYATFLKRVRWLSGPELAARRGGRRAANAAMPPTDPALRGLRASRAFQTAHVDHYLSDIYVVVARTDRKIYTARAWVTLMVDEYSGAVLAMSMSLRAPSRWACAAVLRDCVYRHGRLPETIVVDQGVEFRSVFFETLLAKLRVNKQERPTGAPRFGGRLERVFGITKEELLSMLDGNIADGPQGRSVSGKFRARKQARLTVDQLYRALDRYFFSHLNCHLRGENASSPNLMLVESLAQFRCSGVKQPYDLEFIVSTALPSRRRSHELDPTRGIRVFGHPYWHPALIRYRSEKVEGIRIDGDDDNIVYFPMHGKWYAARRRATAETLPEQRLERMAESIVHFGGRRELRRAREDRDIALAALTQSVDRGRRISVDKQVGEKTAGKRARQRQHREVTTPLITKRRAA